MKKLFLLPVFILLSFISNAQYFEGEIEYKDFFLNKNTFEPLFDPIKYFVTIKQGKLKSIMPDAQQGAVEWQIDDYAQGFSWSRKSYKNSKVPNVTGPPTVSKDGKLLLKKDTTQTAPIMKGKLCQKTSEASDTLIQMDTTVVINGITCKVMLRQQNGLKLSEYYYTDSIRIHPVQYNCNRIDGLNKFYQKTKGALLVQLVEYGDLYCLIQQIQTIKPGIVKDAEFNLPKGIAVIPYKED